ncbi:MAG: division/cell wall cluster transcriptional repressor MraZ [Gammaproteobacteria bacterium]
MFRGISAVNIDAKGRFALPARYRDKSDKNFVVTIDTEVACLLIYPLVAWEKIEEKLQALPSFNRAARRIQRLLIGHATEIELDDAGRFLLPKVLRDYAGLTKKAVLIGQGTKFELWDEATWETHRGELLDEATGEGAELPEELGSISL